MKANIFISGRITKGETLVDVIRQYKSFEDPAEVVVEIKSNGGNKDEGEAVYDYLKKIDEEIPVTTKTGKAYSIAAKIFAAGSTRIVEDTDNALMIHFARAKTEGTAEELEIIAAELREIENDFIEFYSEHLNIDEETVRNLLDNETFVTGKEAVELGFATEVEKEAEIIAELNIDKSKVTKMTKKKEDKKGFFKKLIADINAYLADEEETEVISELTLQDSNGTDIVFPDLESDSTPKVGDKATIDGAEIKDGSYIMPSLEDSTVVFVDGEISEIIPKEEEPTTETEAETKEVTAEVTAETEGLEISTWSMRLVNDTFAEGDIVKYYDWEDEERLVTAAEIKLPDGRTIVTDAGGVIVRVKEADESLIPETETEANFDELLEKVTKKVKDEVIAEFETKLAEKDEEIKSLKAKKGSKEFKAEKKEITSESKKEKGASRYLVAAKNL